MKYVDDDGKTLEPNPLEVLAQARLWFASVVVVVAMTFAGAGTAKFFLDLADNTHSDGGLVIAGLSLGTALVALQWVNLELRRRV